MNPAPNGPEAEASVDFVQSFARGLSIIRAFDAEHPELSLSEVARRAEMPRAAARRFLRTLETLGYVRGTGEGANRSFSLTPRVLDCSDIVYIARVPTRRIMSVRITIGTRFPAYATSMGRVLLAGLPEDERDAVLTASALPSLTDRTLTDPDTLRDELARVREQGWSLVDGELEPGLRSVAAPLHGRGGRVVAAVNVS